MASIWHAFVQAVAAALLRKLMLLSDVVRQIGGITWRCSYSSARIWWVRPVLRLVLERRSRGHADGRRSEGATRADHYRDKNATFEEPRSEGAPSMAILRNVSAHAYSLGFQNGRAVFSLSADVVPIPAVTGRGTGATKEPAVRTLRFAPAPSPSLDTPRKPDESGRLVAGETRLAMGSAIRFTATAGVSSASGTCSFGTSTFDTPTVAALLATSPPAAPSGLRVRP
jgi:hypothetical protein